MLNARGKIRVCQVVLSGVIYEVHDTQKKSPPSHYTIHHMNHELYICVRRRSSSGTLSQSLRGFDSMQKRVEEGSRENTSVGYSSKRLCAMLMLASRESLAISRGSCVSRGIEKDGREGQRGSEEMSCAKLHGSSLSRSLC